MAYLTYPSFSTEIEKNLFWLKRYFLFLKSHDWNYYYSDSYQYKLGDVNQQKIETISKTSARHRCLYISIKRNKINHK